MEAKFLCSVWRKQIFTGLSKDSQAVYFPLSIQSLSSKAHWISGGWSSGFFMGLVMIAGSLEISSDAVAACLRAGRTASVQDHGKEVEPTSLPLSDPFRGFVDDILQVIDSRADSASGLFEVRFLRRRLGEVSGQAIAEAGTLGFHSPWLEVRRFADNPCRTAMTFIWDERQMLVDQVLLSGGSLGAWQPATPAALTKWVQAYEAAAFRVSPEERERRVTALSGTMPSEILWLFRHSFQSTRGPFAGYVADGLATLEIRTAPAYRTMAVALIDHAASVDQPSAIRDIRQTASFFDIQSLRVETIR